MTHGKLEIEPLEGANRSKPFAAPPVHNSAGAAVGRLALAPYGAAWAATATTSPLRHDWEAMRSGYVGRH